MYRPSSHSLPFEASRRPQEAGAWHCRPPRKDQNDAGGSIAAAQAGCMRMATDEVSGADCTAACCPVSCPCAPSAAEALPSETRYYSAPVQHATSCLGLTPCQLPWLPFPQLIMQTQTHCIVACLPETDSCATHPPASWSRNRGLRVIYLCPEAQVQDASAADGAMRLDLNHPAPLIACDDVHLHAQMI